MDRHWYQDFGDLEIDWDVDVGDKNGLSMYESRQTTEVALSRHEWGTGNVCSNPNLVIVVTSKLPPSDGNAPTTRF
jgi:hypothetical protein